MTQKIKNLNTKITPEQINAEWANVLSVRNKMLASSDWTQLKDVILDKEQVNFWKNWRKKLRNVKRKVFSTPKDAEYVLQLLEKQIPQTVNFSSYIEDQEVTVEEKRNKIVETVLVKEKPVIIREEVSESVIQDIFIKTFSENPLILQNFLNKILYSNYDTIFSDYDSLEIYKNKLLNYLKIKTNEIFLDKIDKQNIHRINQKYDEAFDFLSRNEPDLDNFPLIKLYVMLNNKNAMTVAYDFIEEKKKLNEEILNSERFLKFNEQRINLLDDKNQANELFIEIKNGY